MLFAKMKRAQGISINTIIIAALALIVLVVLIAIFTGRMGIWGNELGIAQKGAACPGTMRQGSCEDTEEQFVGNLLQCDKNQVSNPDSNKCWAPGWTCCVTAKK